jgi:type VI secretion system protein ImpA
VPSLCDLLRPISPNNPSGANLRYDPVMDQIRDAQMEEDDSLPVGDWGRQTKRADYVRVASLAIDELQNRSKDLWLAGWLGEAWIRLDGLPALEKTLRLLLELQQEFWSSLYPEIEDGDTTLRAAPLQWSLDAYASLVYEFPIETRGTRYSTYKALRLGGRFDEGELTVEIVDGFIAASHRIFYEDSKDQLTQSLDVLNQLYALCEERYGKDGPSFVRLRAAVDELHHACTQILRREPDVRATGVESQGQFSEEVFRPEEEVEIAPHRMAVDNLRDEPRSVPIPSVAHDSLSGPASWQDVKAHLETCAAFCKQNPQTSLGLLLALALQGVMRQIDGERSDSPSSDTRLTLKRAADSGDWDNVLQDSLTAICRHNGPPWLDLFRYLCLAASCTGSSELEQLSLGLVRNWIRKDSELPRATFADGTPIANPETQVWIESEVTGRTNEGDSFPQAVISPLAPVDVDETTYGKALVLAEEGSLEQAMRLLMDDSSVLKGGRRRFLRWLDLARLLMKTGNLSLANGVLRKLIEEVDERRLDTWEDRDLVGEVLSMLLQTISREGMHSERNALFLRLCRIHPVFALAVQPVGEE